MTGLKVKSETVFIGNPTVGKDAFAADPGAGIVLPVLVNVFDDGHGNTIASYVPPSHLLSEFGNAKVTGIAKMLDGKLQGLVGMLGQQERDDAAATLRIHFTHAPERAQIPMALS